MHNTSEVKHMRANLIAEMARRSISINDVAALLKIHRNSVSNKLYGRSAFTLEEAFAIYDRFFSDLNFRILFATVVV